MTTENAEIVLLDAARAYEPALGGRLIAVYALGSLAHGGFAPRVSDDSAVSCTRTTSPQHDETEYWHPSGSAGCRADGATQGAATWQVAGRCIGFARAVVVLAREGIVDEAPPQVWAAKKPTGCCASSRGG